MSTHSNSLGFQSLESYAGDLGISINNNIPPDFRFEKNADLMTIIMESLVRLAIKNANRHDRVTIGVEIIAGGEPALNIMLDSKLPAPDARTLEGELAAIRPFLKILRATVLISNPAPCKLQLQVRTA